MELLSGRNHKRDIPWEKVPFVPRPGLVPDPVTAFGKRKPENAKTAKVSILHPSERAKIRPKILIQPPQPYVSARDHTRESVLRDVRKIEEPPSYSDSIDVILPRVHKVAEQPNLPYKKRIIRNSDLTLPFYV
ncbi:hypothetical protein WA026_011302 [Henosepilachna vigintioctopunctata]|uniref:Testicular haploid expressed protein n=1 Tax=Henosepilachna vigintioctopunctata TaxID=420089 RepID=A0AAW1TZV8_9CUCU